MRFERPTDPATKEPPVPRIPEWTETVADQLPTDDERVAGRAGVQAARAALQAATRPTPPNGSLAPPTDEEDVWKPRRPKLNF